MVRKSLLVQIIFALCCASGRGQVPARKIDVASVKVHTGELPREGGSLSISGPRITFRGFGLMGLLWFAYEVRMDLIVSRSPLGGNYDVEILAEGDAPLTRDQFRPLVRAILEERFSLKAHREMRPTPVYALVVGKNGPKFKESAPDTISSLEPTRDGHNIGSIVKGGTMAELAVRIAGLERPIVDATGLTGRYDFKLVYTTRGRMTPDDLSAVDIFTAVQEQLGLKLEPRVVPLEVLVIDHVERPSEN